MARYSVGDVVTVQFSGEIEEAKRVSANEIKYTVRLPDGSYSYAYVHEGCIIDTLKDERIE